MALSMANNLNPVYNYISTPWVKVKVGLKKGCWPIVLSVQKLFPANTGVALSLLAELPQPEIYKNQKQGMK